MIMLPVVSHGMPWPVLHSSLSDLADSHRDIGLSRWSLLLAVGPVARFAAVEIVLGHIEERKVGVVPGSTLVGLVGVLDLQLEGLDVLEGSIVYAEAEGFILAKVLERSQLRGSEWSTRLRT